MISEQLSAISYQLSAKVFFLSFNSPFTILHFPSPLSPILPYHSSNTLLMLFFSVIQIGYRVNSIRGTQFRIVLEAIKQLFKEGDKPSRKIGF